MEERKIKGERRDKGWEWPAGTIIRKERNIYRKGRMEVGKQGRERERKQVIDKEYNRIKNNKVGDERRLKR